MNHRNKFTASLLSLSNLKDDFDDATAPQDPTGELTALQRECRRNEKDLKAMFAEPLDRKPTNQPRGGANV